MKTISETYKEKEKGFEILLLRYAEKVGTKDVGKPKQQIENFNRSTLTAILQREVERLEGMKPTALGRHHTYCLYRKGDGMRDLWECDCEIIQYTKAIDDQITYLNEQINNLSK